MVLDEGGVVISDGLSPLTRMPIALVGTAEKVCCYLIYPVSRVHFCCTCLSDMSSALDTTSSSAAQDYSLLEVRATSPGGHASMPPIDDSSVSWMQ
jgi:hypothetical protein